MNAMQPVPNDAGRTAAETRVAAGEARGGMLWVSVGLLTVISVLNFLDRYLPTILAEQIKHDLRLSDTMLGAIFGFVFLIVYAVVGIPIARVADRGHHGMVIGVSVALWNLMTLLGGLAQTGWQFAASRLGVALGEAGNTPASHAYISSNFPPERRTVPLALTSIGSPVGKMLALAGGGYLAQHHGWRVTMVIAGVIGLVVSILPFFVLKRSDAAVAPARRRSDAGAPKIWSLLRRRDSLFLLITQAWVAAGAYAFISFAPAYLMRVHAMTVEQAGREYGLMVGLVGPVGVFAFGWLAQRLAARDPRWLIGVNAILLFLTIPVVLLAFTSASRTMTILCYGLISITTMAVFPPTVSALHRLVEPALRAQASAMALFFAAAFGGLGPFFVGMISDRLQPTLGQAALGRGLIVVVPVCFALSAITYLLALRSAEVALKRDDGFGG